MTATVPAAFDPKPKALGVVFECTAHSAILAGQLVAFNGTGVDWHVEPADGTTTAMPIGVALYSQATAGGLVAIAGPGSIVKVCEGDGSAGLDAGNTIMASASTALGCVSTYVDTADAYEIGVMLEDAALSSTGYALLTAPYFVSKGA